MKTYYDKLDAALAAYPFSQWVDLPWAMRFIDLNWIRDELNVWDSDIKILVYGRPSPKNVLFCFRMESDLFRFMNELEEMLDISIDDYTLDLS